MEDLRHLRLGTIELVVDLNRTPPLNSYHWDWCECDGCTEERMTRERFMPSELKEFLKAADLNPMQPMSLEDSGLKKDDLPGMHRRILTYCLHGKVDQSSNKTRKVQFEKGSIIWIDTDPTTDELDRLRQYSPNTKLSGLLYIRASLTYPCLLDELKHHINIGSHLCPECSHIHAIQGYLNRTTRITTWYDLPELEKALAQGNQEIVATLCSNCAYLTWAVNPA